MMFKWNKKSPSDTIIDETDGVITYENGTKVYTGGKMICGPLTTKEDRQYARDERVKKIEIDVENAFVLLTLEDGKTVNEAMIRERVKDAGFTAREIKEVPSDG